MSSFPISGTVTVMIEGSLQDVRNIDLMQAEVTVELGFSGFVHGEDFEGEIELDDSVLELVNKIHDKTGKMPVNAAAWMEVAQEMVDEKVAEIGIQEFDSTPDPYDVYRDDQLLAE